MSALYARKSYKKSNERALIHRLIHKVIHSCGKSCIQNALYEPTTHFTCTWSALSMDPERTFAPGTHLKIQQRRGFAASQIPSCLLVYRFMKENKDKIYELDTEKSGVNAMLSWRFAPL